MMKKSDMPFMALFVAVLVLLFAGCPIDREVTLLDGYVSFPKAEIMGASFYAGDGVDAADAGSITENDDGTYTIRIRRREGSRTPSAIFFYGPFSFTEYYSLTADFPDDPNIVDKPFRIYVCASTSNTSGMDGNLYADYPTAWDSRVFAAFRNDEATGFIRMSNDIVNKLNVRKDGKPYVTVFMYLYFKHVTNPGDYYEFTLHKVGASDGVTPEGPVIHAAAYRDGDTNTAHTFTLTEPVLPDFVHRYDSKTINALSPAYINVDIQVPLADVGKEIEFEIRNLGLFAGNTNLIPNGKIQAGNVLFVNGASESPGGTVTEGSVTNTAGITSYFYKIKAKTVAYGDLFGAAGTGVKLKIPGTFNDTTRFTFGINLPTGYAGE